MNEQQLAGVEAETEGKASGVKTRAQTTDSVTGLRPGQDKDYFTIALSKHSNNLTIFRKVPKVRGKAAVKAEKRARHR